MITEVVARAGLKPGETVHIKLAGDGRDLHKNKKSVLLAFSLLNTVPGGRLRKF
jgi:hypothetical protein